MKRPIAFIVCSIALFLMLTGCASWGRGIKTLGSDLSGGLNRTVTAYDYNGNILGQWSGKFDVSDSAEETYFDFNGKRIIIQNAIIINEEN